MAAAQNETIACMSAQGASTRDIQAKTGVPFGTVARKLKTPEIRALIDQAHSQIAVHVTEVAGRLVMIALDDDHKDQLNAIKIYCQIMGLSPSHATSQFITQIYNDNRVQTVNPGVLQALGGNLSMLTGQDEGVQDGEYEDVKDE